MLESVQCDFSSSLCQFFQRHMEIIAEPFGIHGENTGSSVFSVKNIAFIVGIFWNMVFSKENIDQRIFCPLDQVRQQTGMIQDTIKWKIFLYSLI